MQQLQSLVTNRAQLRVRRQLIEAIMFEGLIKYEEKRIGDELSYFKLFGKKHLFCCVGKRTAFDRIRIKEDTIFRIHTNNVLQEVTIEELVEEIVSSEKDKARLLNELQQTIKLCEWNEENLTSQVSRRGLSYEELESEISEGHPYHPCFKSRTGFTTEDHYMYGPEAKQSFALQWVAVRRSHVRVAVCEEEADFWKKELGHLMWEILLAKLEMLGGTLEEYTFIPVHPWQWQSIKHELSDYTERHDLLPLDVKGDYYRATQSVRTLWNASNPEKAHLKCSMNMVNTSSLRKLYAYSVCTAPAISAWIKGVVQADSYLQHSLVVLEEYAGIIFEPEGESATKEQEGLLGAIWRESVRAYMEDGEEAVPFTALMMMEQDGRPFIAEWLLHYGTEAWIQRLIEVSVIPVWHLLVAHGIGVEAHAQNMMLLHKNGWPTRVVLRDFHESVEYTEDFLADASTVPHFGMIHERLKDAPIDDYYLMSSVEALRELVMDTLFVFHFSELSYLLEEEYGYKEEQFWLEVTTAIRKHIERFPHLLSRNHELHHTKALIPVESLLTKKLQNQEDGSFRHNVRNALSK